MNYTLLGKRWRKICVVSGVLLTDEEFWQEQRRFVVRHLKEFGFGRRTMAELVEEEADQLVQAFRHKLQGSKVRRIVCYMFIIDVIRLKHRNKSNIFEE